ncbi:hypothetical protein CBR_g166 [Chara braunii]|uniref:Uncharacterized protein n=1 Tax=Chara braunii TaxID=69332 RepID=A0A388JLS6_CHABU|nr:hypothetical protein CBR_g166 [Chara braunii]|eukprot:GBG58766.1 hypothetical protein CBR_g166 [Chara braunii]
MNFVAVRPRSPIAEFCVVGFFLQYCVSVVATRLQCHSRSACTVSAALSSMADLYRRLPLLLLVVVVFVRGRKATPRSSTKARKMDNLQKKTTPSAVAGGSSRLLRTGVEGGRRTYDPTLYIHLPSHEIPLPPSDGDADDPRSSTVPLGSDWTQDWMGSQLFKQPPTPTYTDLPEGWTLAGYDAALVDLSFGLRSGSGPGKPSREAIGDCADYFVAIANGDAGAEPPSMLIMPPNDVPRFKIDDPAQREPTLCKVRIVEKLVLRTIHRWIFKSSSRSNDFARAESYITVDYATDVARAVWKGLEWSRVVSPTLVYYMLHMKMDMPLWFEGVKIVDKPEYDDMAPQQRATILRVVGCWTDALWCGQWGNGGRLKQERLTRLADCLRVLLSVCMWIMRMGGDDDHSHYDAGLHASLTTTPTLIAAGSYIFNWRRHIVDSTNLVLDHLGTPHLTLGEYPHCIPKWVDCRLVCDHNATLKNGAEAAKHDWIDNGPPADEDGGDGK